MRPIRMGQSVSLRCFLRLWGMLFLWVSSGWTGPSLPAPSGAIFEGRVIDDESGEPVGLTYLLIDALHFWQPVHADGTFRFENLPPGTYGVKTYRMGYRETRVWVTLRLGEVTTQVFRLRPDPLMLQGLLTTEGWGEGKGISKEKPDVVLSDKRLRQSLGMTIAKTLEAEAGIDQVTMGPVPARPVLRGMAGERFLLLEDAAPPGDLSSSSVDHAVVIEPLTSSRIEIIRGPEAYLYGSSPIGGVVRVIRETIPRRRPTRSEGIFSLQGESVNHGGAGALEWRMPLGPLALRCEGTLRKASDLRTPLGRIPNTSVSTHTGSLGVSGVGAWGFVGLSVDQYASCYGIPPDPLGGHPGGVHIDLDRTHVAGEGLLHLPFPSFRHLWIRVDQNRYHHVEIERNGEVGTEFGLVTWMSTAIIHFGGGPWFEEARLGWTVTWKDFAAGGLSFIPRTDTRSIGLFFYDERPIGRWRFSGAIRYDRSWVTPDERRWAPGVGLIRERLFGGVSGALASHYRLGRGWTLGLRMIRSFRPPRVEELFSEGPHLAVYAYEVGNADLDSEKGWGGDLSVEGVDEKGSFRLALYRYLFSDYLFPQNTGLRSWRRADLDLYRYVGMRAEVEGIEASFDWSFRSWWGVLGRFAWTQGMLSETRHPLPQMPPWGGNIGIRMGRSRWGVELLSRWAGPQHRTGAFEKSTAGYLVWNLSGHWIFSHGPFYHTVTVTFENLGDTVYRRHLNRIKELMPEPGRNFRILYRVYF